MPFADHDALIARATLVVGHGGHGTTMRALRHGLPMVGIPATGAGQVPITELIEQWGTGRALSQDADVDHGAIAQLGERLDRTQEVGGSSPPSSMSRKPC